MRWSLTNLLLLILVLVLGQHTVACAARSEVQAATAVHGIACTAAHQMTTGSIHTYSKGKPARKTHCHHKAHKKFFPGKVIFSSRQQLRQVAGQEEVLVHYAVVRAYQFLYFKTINPPPPKA